MNILIDQSVGEMTTPLWFFDVFFHISLGHFLYELFHRNFLISTSSSTKQQETFCRMEIENSNSAGYFKNIQEFSTFLILNPLQPHQSNFTSLNATKGKPLKSRGIIISTQKIILQIDKVWWQKFNIPRSSTFPSLHISSDGNRTF